MPLVAAVLGFGPVVAAGGEGGKAPREIWNVPGHGQLINRVAYSPDGLLAASVSADGTAKIWRRSDGALLRTITRSMFGVFPLHSVIFSPDGASIVATGTGGGTRYAIADGAPIVDYVGMETGLQAVFSGDGEFVAIAGSASGLEEATLVFRADDGTPVASLLFQLTGNYAFDAALSAGR